MRKSARRTPRPVSAGAFNRVLTAGQPLDDTQVLDITLHARIAFQAMRSSKSNEENWVAVATALNMACVLCEIGVGAEYRADLIPALEACWRVKMRAARTGSWAFDGAGMQAVAFGLELHDEQVKVANCRQVRFVIDEIRRRVLADEVYKNVEHLTEVSA